MSEAHLSVNSRSVAATAEPRTSLADFLREELMLTGTHLGCEHGVCGACTLFIDGRPARACITLLAACEGTEVRTIEGYADDPVMSALRAAFKQHHALQCGFCTPGMLASAYDIVTRLPDADETRIRAELAGNLCRCTGYMGIVAAIKSVLAAGPHSSQMPLRDPLFRSSLQAQITAAPAPVAAPAELATALPAEPVLAGGTILHKSVEVNCDAEDLWRRLRDVHQVARALPGAEIARIQPDGTIEGRFKVALGPISAEFGGAARVAYDDAEMKGTASGTGSDRLSRTRNNGTLSFAVRPLAAHQAVLDIEIRYVLSGPLAHFGRPALVSGLAGRLMEDFAANIAADGPEPVARPKAANGMALLWSLLRGLLPWRRARKAPPG